MPPPNLDQKEFIKRAVTTLSIRGMILPVRLALLSLVFQSREWTTKTLLEIGGIEGLEIEFFSNIFDFEYANRRYRAHQKAAQSVLSALLPKDNIGIKRPKRPRHELLDASGYAKQPNLFEDLMRILDKELFLITPIDQLEGLGNESKQATMPNERYYQLTHDFLVPSLKEWQSSKEQIAVDIVNSIMRSATTNLPSLLNRLEGIHFWADPKLREIALAPNGDPKERLHASLALLPVDAGQVDYLYERMLSAAPTELTVIRDALESHREKLIENLWSVLEHSLNNSRFLQAASALALYDLDSRQWGVVCDKVSQEMVTVNAVDLGNWMDVLRPIRKKLRTPLAAVFRDENRPESERTLAMNILANYASDDAEFLTELLMDAQPKAFANLFRVINHQAAKSLPLLRAEIEKVNNLQTRNPESEQFNDRQIERKARAAVALVRMGWVEEVLPLLRHSPYPQLRNYILNWMEPLGVDPHAISDQFKHIDVNKFMLDMTTSNLMDNILFHPQISIMRTLILALGTYGTKGLSHAEREALSVKLIAQFRDDPDAGIHGATEWTLRRWNQHEELQSIERTLSGKERPEARRWYTNSCGHTLSLVYSPVTFAMSSPHFEPGRYQNEHLHEKNIAQSFFISTKVVTVGQYRNFLQFNPQSKGPDENEFSNNPANPMTGTTWYHAVEYCNWLSKVERLSDDQLCYEPIGGVYKEGMNIPKDYMQRSGYRLPTEAEWEYACRAGSMSSRYFGDSDELLVKYCNSVTNQTKRVCVCGDFLPNDLGLFDTLGNVHEWAHGVFRSFTSNQDVRTLDEKENTGIVDDKINRCVRGGAFDSPPQNIRSANRGKLIPRESHATYGFRIARSHH